MKKVKIMLTAIFVLAIIGGVAAYRARGIHTICSRMSLPGACSALSVPGVLPVFLNGDPTFYYTFKPAGVPCSMLQCTSAANDLWD